GEKRYGLESHVGFEDSVLATEQVRSKGVSSSAASDGYKGQVLINGEQVSCHLIIRLKLQN
ncbi:hypothetical protein, partial [Cronobacter sakazakii]|uniref:hypothetical protein n=1 Tax=Cronobacter sakazakii TaxID=28141 RepID=UPI000D42B7E8